MKRFIFLVIYLITAIAVYAGNKGKETPDTSYFMSIYSLDTGKNAYEGQYHYVSFDLDGYAVVVHCGRHEIYECYRYSRRDGMIYLTGLGTVEEHPWHNSKLKAVPENMSLEVTGNTEGVLLSGKYSSGRKVECGDFGRLKITSSIPRIVKELCGVQYDYMASKVGSLWLIDYEYGISAYVDSLGYSVKSFSDGDILAGEEVSPSSDYVALDYMDGEKAYVDKKHLKRVRSVAELDDILFRNANALENYVEWVGTFPEKIRENEVKGYFNGILAGKLAVNFFIPFIIIMIVLLFMYKYEEPEYFYPDFLHYASLVTLILLTLLELWYAVSLGRDAFWMIFQSFSLLYAFGGFFGFIILATLQMGLIIRVETNLLVFNETAPLVPRWLENILGFAAAVFGVVLFVTGGSVGVLMYFGLALLVSLPTSLTAWARSRKYEAMLPFYLICYPMKYIMFLGFVVLYVLRGASQVKVSTYGDSDSSDTEYGRSLEGDTEVLTRLSGNNYMDSKGNTYQKNGNTFSPNGPGGGKTLHKS